MNLRRLWSIIRKETVQVLRDRRTLMSIIILPIIQLAIYGYLDSNMKHQRTIVLDNSNTQESRNLVQAFVNTQYFDICCTAHGVRDVEAAIDANRAKVGIEIPPDYAAAVRTGTPASVAVVVDASDATAARVSLSVAQGVGASIAQQTLIRQIRRSGQQVPVPSPDIRARAWYNPDLRSEVFIVPGVLALILQFAMTMLAISIIVRERELGTLEQLVASPVQPAELMLGKIIPIVGLGYLNVTMVLAVSWLWFGVPVRGSLLELYVLILAFFFSTVGLGTLVSTVANNFQQAIQMGQFFLMPSMLLSGFIFPRETLPTVLQWVSDVLPLTYFLVIVRGIIIKGVGFHDLWPQILALVTLGVVVFSIAVARFQKRIV
jgi:ABC-2 type transport system permease protein